MKIRVDFYRTRTKDNAHAIVGRVDKDVDDLNAAVSLARSLLQTLTMPQTPDGMAISDGEGNVLRQWSITRRDQGSSLPAYMLIPLRAGWAPSLEAAASSLHSGLRVPIVCARDQYGRRIEADRSWTVYHVFTGLPAHQAGRQLIGFDRRGATAQMLRLNAPDTLAQPLAAPARRDAGSVIDEFHAAGIELVRCESIFDRSSADDADTLRLNIRGAEKRLKAAVAAMDGLGQSRR